MVYGVLRRLPDWTWLVWPPLGALAVQVVGFRATGLPFTWAVTMFGLAAVWLTRIGRLRSGSLAEPGWEFAAERRVLCGETGAVLTLATIPFSMPRDFPLAVAVAVPLAVAFFVIPRLARIARALPELRLLPDGIVVRGRHLRWDDIDRVELRSTFWPTVVIRGRSVRPAVLRELHVRANLVYLLDLVGYYLAHPERRPAIGTAEEAARIHAALLTARLAAPVGTTPIPLPS